MVVDMDPSNQYQPRLVGTTGDLYQGSTAETASRETSQLEQNGGKHPTHTRSKRSPSPHNDESNYFKNAQWSPDGTTILASLASNSVATFVLPPSLLSENEPHNLAPYASCPFPEPIYATAFNPSFSLQEPSTGLILASPRALPIRLFSPFAKGILASYPLVSRTTEAWITPHSLLFNPSEPHHFFAGSDSSLSLFDINRNGEGPISHMPTTPSRRNHATLGSGGMKGIVSALGMNMDGILAAGTFTRWVGLYDSYGCGGSAGVFSIATGDEDEKGSRGGGITQVLWSACGRYLCVIERASDGLGVWDVRGTGKRLAWLRGRGARTQQRLGAEIMGKEVWAGGTDGVVRVWEGLGMKEGVVDPEWEFKAHDDVISSTTLHPSGSVLATCSGQRLDPKMVPNVQASESDADRDVSSLSSSNSQSSISSLQRGSSQVSDNSLNLWAL